MRKNFAIEILILFFLIFFVFESFQEEPKSGNGLLPKSDAQLHDKWGVNNVFTVFCP